ncbi:hypothetical protein Arub01_37610 [Actinomadura rubrobrunea]|uniref:Uncharacterized protein n=1 Tax=Actinomadura rubrobrunea TaxID=115335 RepID=A0A9W6PZF9_9ACTN|nr:hypothetical protein [Actinomadura rubrobrunea]GLW65517.1 hypothetical protein Arub01_37610 [Actinomadura rubrobrunea]
MARLSMRITLDAAMRARDVSRAVPDEEDPPATGSGSAPKGAAEPADASKRSRSSRNERRRQGKRGGARRFQ